MCSSHTCEARHPVPRRRQLYSTAKTGSAAALKLLALRGLLAPAPLGLLQRTESFYHLQIFHRGNLQRGIVTHNQAAKGERTGKMAVFRTEKTEDFTIMSNYHFKDRRLSLKAKGLLSMMLSFSDDWQYSLMGLAATSKEGLTAIRAAVQELEDNGYLVRRRLRTERGRMANIEYDIYEIPLSKFSIAENPI